MLNVLQVAKSGYYAWLKRPKSNQALENEKLSVGKCFSRRRTRAVIEHRYLAKKVVFARDLEHDFLPGVVFYRLGVVEPRHGEVPATG